MKTIVNLSNEYKLLKDIIMEKTAVQELIEWLESDSELMVSAFHEKWQLKKAEMLELEKQQIINSYSYGWRLAMALKEHTPNDPEGFYNANYIHYGTEQRLQGNDTGTGTSEVL